MKGTGFHKDKTLTIEISIIIVNYKSWNHLNSCLKSLDLIPQDDFTFEVIVVDNHSNDDTLPAFINKFPKYQFILNSGNNGFSNGCNVGAKKARGDYYLFLNPDTIITKEAIFGLKELALNNPDYGAISSAKQNLKGHLEKEARFFPTLSTLLGIFRAFNKFLNKSDIHRAFSKTKDIVFPDWVSGSIILTSKDWFNKINGWNEDYWLYLEDVDFCKRITKIGGRVALSRKFKILHNHGGASRINIKTAALTKTEVIISKHVYISNHFKGLSKYLGHVILLSFTLLTKLILSIIGIIFFYIPKLFVNCLIFIRLLKYYGQALPNNTWISKRAPNYPN